MKKTTNTQTTDAPMVWLLASPTDGWCDIRRALRGLTKGNNPRVSLEIIGRWRRRYNNLEGECELEVVAHNAVPEDPLWDYRGAAQVIASVTRVRGGTWVADLILSANGDRTVLLNLVNEMKEGIISVPPIEEQTRFANFLVR